MSWAEVNAMAWRAATGAAAPVPRRPARLGTRECVECGQEREGTPWRTQLYPPRTPGEGLVWICKPCKGEAG
jgi:hypothetical protein